MKPNLLKIEAIFCRRKKNLFTTENRLPRLIFTRKKLVGKSEPSYKKGGNGSTCVELIFPVEVNLPGFIYLPSIFCEPGNSAATTGTSDEAWTSWLWQADRLTTRASDTVLHSSGSCGRGNLSCKSSYLHYHFFSVPCAPQSYRSRNCFK